ncbi:lipopolysaccharide biosynthesis protein [Flavobacterium sp. LAR06]|uniref:lipopolysaccharide biosynthesis protein n=1 Tax=Flavobacterium sp. LAR06 TaxID=3064897 RepID=UPI0035BEE68F
MKSKNSSLLRNTIIYGIGSFGSKILSFALIPLYSFYLNKGEFGYFDLVTTAISLIVPFATLQISDSVFRWLLTSEGNLETKKKCITNGVLLILVNTIIVGILSSIFYLFYPLKGHFIITLICINAMIYPFFQQIARGLNMNKLFAFNGILYTLIYLLSNIVFLFVFKLSIDALFYSTFIAYFFCSFFLFFQLKIYAYIDIQYFSVNSIKELVKYSLPLIPNTISWWLISSVNKYLILAYLGISANGVFAMANRFPAILVIVNQVFTLAWQEAAIINFNSEDKKKYYSEVFKKLIKIQFSLVVLLSLSSRFLVEELISEEFHDSWLFMPVLYLSVAFLSFSGFFGALYLGVKQTKEIFTTTIFGSLTNIIIGVVLIRYFGLMGIAIATCFGYAILFIVRLFTTRKILEIDFPIQVFFKYLLCVSLSFAIVYMFNAKTSLLSIIFFLAFFGIDNKDVINGFWNKILLKFK